MASNCQLRFLNQRKEKRKYVAGTGIENGTSDPLVRRPTDCVTDLAVAVTDLCGSMPDSVRPAPSIFQWFTN